MLCPCGYSKHNNEKNEIRYEEDLYFTSYDRGKLRSRADARSFTWNK